MDKQKEILKYLATVEKATLSDIYDAVPFGYYYNGHKHLGDMLARMVNSRKIERVKKGVFKRLSPEYYQQKYKSQVSIFDKNQTQLF